MEYRWFTVALVLAVWISPSLSQGQPPACYAQVDLAFVMDVSTSITWVNPANWDLMKNFVQYIAGAFPISQDATRVAVITFSDQARVEFYLDQYSNSAELSAAINRTTHTQGETNVPDALELLRTEVFANKRGDRERVKNVAIIITDGKTNVNPERLPGEAQRAKDAGIEIFAVGITEDDIVSELNIIASDPDANHVFFAQDFNNLADIRSVVISRACEVVPTFSPTLTTPPRTVVPEGDCQVQADICFLIDSSGSIRDNNPSDQSYDNWQLLLNFVKNIINHFPISPQQTRIGVVKFSNIGTLQFDLDDYTDKPSMLAAVDRISYAGGFTNTSGGLRVMRSQCFNPAQGDRFDVPNIAIVITDGVPTREEAQTLPEARRVKQEGIFVFAIGITNLVNDDLLRDLSSPPQAKGLTWFSSPDFQNLGNVLDTLVKQACVVPTQPPACYALADIAFVLDASGSITFNDPSNWGIMLEFVQFITNGFPVNPDHTRHALVRFSTSANVEFFFNTYQNGAEVRNAISRLQNDGGETNIAEALRLLRTQVFNTANGDRSQIQNVAIIITDGQANREADRVEEEVRLAKEAGIELFVVGITDDVNPDELNLIASDPDQTHVFEVKEFNVLMEVLFEVIENTCNVVSTFIPQTGTTPVRPRTTLAPTSPPTTRKPVTDCDGGDADVVVIMDTSGSIGSRNFKQVTGFVSNVISGLNIEGGRIRVGVMTFSDNPRREFNMNQYQTRSQMETAVNDIVYTRGTTNTAAALQFAREQMFTTSAGDRNRVRNIILIITDGESNNAERTLEQSKLTKASGIHIVSVGVGGWIDLHELRSMASYPNSENMIHVTDFSSFDTILNKIKEGICDTNKRCDSNPCINGQCVDMVGYYLCNCNPGWGGKSCETRCSVATDVVFVLDNSGSIGRENFMKMVDFVVTAVETLDIDNGQQSSQGTRVGLLAYANGIQSQFNLNAYRSRLDILNNMDVRYTGGTTNTASAIRNLREEMFQSSNGDRPNVPNIAIIFTDGKSDNPDETWKEAVAARKAGITIMTVGIGGGVSMKELTAITSAPVEQNVLRVNDFDTFSTILNGITNGLCDNNRYCDSNPCRGGAQCKDVINGFECGPCPRGYTGFLCERRCSGEADVVFVIDSSGSIRVERYPMVLDFIESVIDNLDVNPDRTRVGAIYWSDSANMHFDLDDYTTRQDVKEAINRTPFLGGRTHTTSALSILTDNMFTPQSGDREAVPNFAIILTDGNSNINPETTIPQAIKARISGAHMIVVSVGKDLGKVELEGIASEPKSANMYEVESIRTLPSILNQIITSFCDDVDECASNPCRNNAQCINGLSRYICLCQPGFTGYNCDRRCSRQLDLTMLLDLSGSVEEEYRMIMQFARRLAYGLDMQFDRTRIATIAFSTDIIDTFYLNTYQNKEAVINALNFYHHGGRTNIPKALGLMTDDIFSQNRGDRPGVRNVGVLVTDGFATVDERNVIPRAEAAKRRDIELFSIAVGDSPNIPELNSVASSPESEHVYQMRALADVDRTADRLLDYLCQ